MIGFRELLVIAIIVLLIFGTKKLRNVGGDLGAAIKNFKSSMREGEAEADKEKKDAADGGRVIDSKVDSKSDRNV